MPVLLILLLAALLLVTGCTNGASGPASPAPGSPSSTQPGGSGPSPSRSPASAPPEPGFDTGDAMSQVEILATDIGPRPAGSAQLREAATFVAGVLREYGYAITRQRLAVPGGTTQNLVAVPPGFSWDRPFRLVAAHLDTASGSPGAVDNAGGVAVLLQLARSTSTFTPDVPVVFAVLGAAEPHGSAQSDSRRGAERLLRSLSPGQREQLLGMVSVDAVGAPAAVVPVCASDDLRDQLMAAAAQAQVPVGRCIDPVSDQLPFGQADLPGARLGGVRYPEHGSAADRSDLVEPRELQRLGRLVRSWIDQPAG